MRHFDIYEQDKFQMLVHKCGKIKNWGGECRDVTPTTLQCQIFKEHCRYLKKIIINK